MFQLVNSSVLNFQILSLRSIANLPPFIVVDQAGQVQFYNEPAHSLSTRFLVAELAAGCSVYRLFEESTAARLRESLALALQGRTGRFLGREAYEVACELYTDEATGFRGACLTFDLSPAANAPVFESEIYRVLENLPLTLITTDCQGIITRVLNPPSPGGDKQLIGRSFAGVFDCQPMGINALEQAMAGEKSRQPVTLRFGGQVLDAYFAPFVTGQSQPGGVIILATDITEKQQVLQTLCDSEVLYRTLAENFPLGSIFLVDRDLRYLSAAGEGLKYTGLPIEEITGKTVREFLPPQVAVEIEPLYRQALAGQAVVEQELAFGGFSYDITVLPIRNSQGEIYAAMAVTWDITRYQKAEQALKASELKIRTAIESIAEAFFLVGADQRVQLYNRQAATQIKEGLGLVVSEGTFYPDVLPPAARTSYFESFPRALNGEYITEEVLLHTYNGIEHWGEVHYAPVLDGNGRTQAVCITLLYISVRKRAEQALRTSEARLRAILDNLPQNFYLVDPEFKLKLFNRQAANQVRSWAGFELAEGYDFQKFISPGNFPEFYRCFAKALAGEQVEQEIKLKSPLRGDFWTEVRYSPVIEDNGSITGVCIGMLDITGRKLAEEALTRSENRLRTTIDNLQQSFFLLDLNHRIELFNLQAVRVIKRYVGITLAEGQDFFDIGLTGYYPEIDQDFAMAASGKFVAVEKELVSDTGRSFWTDIRFHPIKGSAGEVSGVCITLLDITDRKLAEAELEISRTRLNTLLNNIPQTFFLLDKDGTLLLFNEVADRYFKQVYNQTLVTGRLLKDQLEPELYRLLDSGLEKVKAGETIRLEILLPDGPGKKFWGAVSASPVFAENGQLSTICLTTSNISERKLAEEALKESEERFSLMLDLAPIPIAMTCQGAFTLVNKAFEKSTGFTRQEVIDQDAGKILGISRQDLEKMRALVRQEGVLKDYEILNVNRWGQEQDILLSMVPLEFQGVPHMLSASYNLTERKKAEQALLNSEARLRSIMDNTRQIFMLLDGDFNLQLFNRYAAEFYQEVRNISLEVGHPIQEYILPHYLQVKA